MCEMISESCLVMVVIRQLRSFTSVPYYYESHSSPRAGLTRRPGPPSEIVDPAEFNGRPTADHGRLRGYPANQPRRDRFQSSPSLPTRWMGKNRPREQQDVTAICRSLTARANYLRPLGHADRLVKSYASGQRSQAMSVFNVGFVIFPELTQLDFTGPQQVLARLPRSAMHIIAKSGSPVPSDSGLSLVPTHTFENCPRLDLICVPGGSTGVVQVMGDRETIEFIRRH